MPSGYYCPRCHSENIILYSDHIECSQCGLNFSIESLETDINDENILAEQELHDFLDAFKELKDEERRKKFFDSLKDDLLDEDD